MNSLKGPEAGRYYTDRLPSYYLKGEEPPGRWWGRAAGRLGLHDQVDPEAFLAVIAVQDPSTGRDLGRRFGEGSVRGYDATFSAPKSVSVLFAVGDDQVREQVIEAHDGAVDAVLGWVEDHAHTRVRRHGHIMHVDAADVSQNGRNERDESSAPWIAAFSRLSSDVKQAPTRPLGRNCYDRKKLQATG